MILIVLLKNIVIDILLTKHIRVAIMTMVLIKNVFLLGKLLLKLCIRIMIS